jgi:hypothetical protein
MNDCKEWAFYSQFHIYLNLNGFVEIERFLFAQCCRFGKLKRIDMSENLSTEK